MYLNNYRPDFWTWENVLTPSEIKEINKIVNDNHHPKNLDRPAENITKTANVNIIKYFYLKKYLKKIFDDFIVCNELQYGFNLYPIRDNTLMNHNTYSNNGAYDFHEDRELNPSVDIKLTAIINLSEDNYEGGEFEVNSSGRFYTIDGISKPGSAIVLRYGILHRVKPVIRGTRITLSYWFNGPKFV